MKWELSIARRYLSRRHRSFFLSVLTWVAVGGVAVGVMSLIVVLSIMLGFQQDFQKKVVGFQAPVLAWWPSGEETELTEEVLRQSGAKGAESFVEGEAIARSLEGRVVGVKLRGTSRLPAEVLQIVWRDGNEVDFKDGILIGAELAAQLQVHPDFDDEIDLIYPLGELGPSGEILPRVRRVQLLGLFRSGFYNYDTKYVLSSREIVKDVLQEGGRAGVEWDVEHLKEARILKESLIRSHLGFEKVETWEELNARLFGALKLERVGMFLILAAMILIATFNVFGLLSIVEMESLKDMALLRALGATLPSIRGLFLYQGATIGFFGTFLGGALGLALTFWLKHGRIPLPHSYYVDSLPVMIHPPLIVAILGVAPLLCLLTSLFPAMKAVRRNPAEALKYE